MFAALHVAAQSSEHEIAVSLTRASAITVRCTERFRRVATNNESMALDCQDRRCRNRFDRGLYQVEDAFTALLTRIDRPVRLIQYARCNVYRARASSARVRPAPERRAAATKWNAGRMGSRRRNLFGES